MAKMNPEHERELVRRHLARRFHGGNVPEAVMACHRVCYDAPEALYAIFWFETPTSDGYTDFDRMIPVPTEVKTLIWKGRALQLHRHLAVRRNISGRGDRRSDVPGLGESSGRPLSYFSQRGLDDANALSIPCRAVLPSRASGRR